MSQPPAPGEDPVALLRLTCDVATHTALADRRRALLRGLLEIIGADAGWWSWGHGHPVRSAVAPIALIDVGFRAGQLTAIIEGSLLEDCQRLLCAPVAERLDEEPQQTVLRTEALDEGVWLNSGFYQCWTRSGLEEFVLCVRYRDRDVDVWSNMFFLRRVGQPAFAERERCVVDQAMAGIRWLHGSPEEAVPPALLETLTPRRRTVLILLLSGQSRKQIADRLNISEHTVHEHTRQLYKHFAVRSAAELAARFLRSKS